MYAIVCFGLNTEAARWPTMFSLLIAPLDSALTFIFIFVCHTYGLVACVGLAAVILGRTSAG